MKYASKRMRCASAFCKNAASVYFECDNENCCVRAATLSYHLLQPHRASHGGALTHVFADVIWAERHLMMTCVRFPTRATGRTWYVTILCHPRLEKSKPSLRLCRTSIASAFAPQASEFFLELATDHTAITPNILKSNPLWTTQARTCI